MGMVNAVVPTPSSRRRARVGARDPHQSPPRSGCSSSPFNLCDDGLVGQQLFAGEPPRLACWTTKPAGAATPSRNRPRDSRGSVALLRRASARSRRRRAFAAACSDTTVTSAPAMRATRATTSPLRRSRRSPPDAAPGRRARRSPPPPDDADPLCANGGTDRCLNYPPGLCPDLASGGACTVRFAGFARPRRELRAGRQTSMGPDAVLPLTLAATSDDVSITVSRPPATRSSPRSSPPTYRGQPTRRLSCVSRSSSIGGIGVLRVSRRPRQAATRSSSAPCSARRWAWSPPSPPRVPGHPATSAPASRSRRRPPSPSTPHLLQHRRPRDVVRLQQPGLPRLGRRGGSASPSADAHVTVNVAGDGMEDPTSRSPACAASRPTSSPAATPASPRRALRNLPPAPTAPSSTTARWRAPTTLNVTVTTAAPTPPAPPRVAPASRCPRATPRRSTSTTSRRAIPCASPRAGQRLLHLRGAEAGPATCSSTSPPTPRAATSPSRSPARAAATPGERAVAPFDHSANSVWGRCAGLTPGRTYTVRGRHLRGRSAGSSQRPQCASPRRPRRRDGQHHLRHGLPCSRRAASSSRGPPTGRPPSPRPSAPPR